MVKLRNPWKEVHYSGRGNVSDLDFWNVIPESGKKSYILSNIKAGAFLMLYEDFMHEFNEVHYCNLEEKGHFTSEPLTFDTANNKKAKYFEIAVMEKGDYSF